MSAEPQPLTLGPLGGPVLVFGGPYSNLEATRALLETAAAHGIPPERCICTGDVVAYCADPEPTARLLRDAGVPVVMGNCEESLAEEAAACGCGFEPGTGCDLLAVRWYAHAASAVSGETRRWMGGLPRRIDFTLNGVRCAVVHGAPSRINRFLFASSPDADKRAEIALAGTDGVIGGHGGLPFTQRYGRRFWHNAGAIGLPANDGTPRVWYSVIAPAGSGLAITHHALDYDHRRAAARMRAEGLPGGYADALETGLWPSCDVLPPAEVAARGRLLALDGHTCRVPGPEADPAPPGRVAADGRPDAASRV